MRRHNGSGPAGWLIFGLVAVAAVACSGAPDSDAPVSDGGTLVTNVPPTPVEAQKSDPGLNTAPTRIPAFSSRPGTPTEDLKNLGVLGDALGPATSTPSLTPTAEPIDAP